MVNSDGEAAGSGELGLLLHDQGTVCDDYFNYTAADAICVELGFGWATRWTNDSEFMIQSDFDMKMDSVRCKKESWISCTFRTDHNCGHSEDVFLECRSAEGWFFVLGIWHNVLDFNNDYANSFKDRRSTTRIRCSSHKLDIEAGRYANIPLERRKCQFCESHEIADVLEDEDHALHVCPIGNHVRTRLRSKPPNLGDELNLAQTFQRRQL